MRGRLLFPFYVEIAQLDTEAIDTAGNYDPVYRTVRKVDTDGDGIGETQRAYKSTVLLPAQIEDRAMEEYNPTVFGNVPEHDMVLVFHFKDLERLSLIDPDGRPSINVGDKLVAIKNKHGTLIRTIPDPPGLYVVEPRDSYDLSTIKRNLLVVFLRERKETADRA